MENKVHELLIKAIQNKVPQNVNVASYVAEVLDIEKESAYRRLRGNVSFTLQEASILVSKLNISMDEIIAKAISEEIRMVMHLPQQYTQHYSMRLKEPWHLDQDIQFLKELANNPLSEIGVALSGISLSLYHNYPFLTKFYLLQYLFNLGNKITFDKVESSLTPAYRNDFRELFRSISTYYIWDRKITQNLVDDILFFKNIQMLSDNDVENLKQELHEFFNDLNEWADLGHFPDTGKRFEFYVSESHIDVSYAYMCSDKVFVSMYTSFTLLTTSSDEKIPYKNVSDWVKSLRRSAIQISESNERERRIFFAKQHAIVDTL